LAQKPFETHLDHIEGIWMEKTFKRSFDSLLSIAAYAQTLPFSQRDISIFPIGLRIQAEEQKQGILTIGYGVLHSHMLYPEVSKFCVQEGDTLYEQGSFSLSVSQQDSSGYYRIPDLMGLFATSSTCLLKVDYQGDTSITLIRKATAQKREITLEYERVSHSFSTSYPHPNPRDYYMRTKTLVGSYEVRDSMNTLISSNVTILPSGLIESDSLWGNRKIEYITDVFCGAPFRAVDRVLIYDPWDLRGRDKELYIYERGEKGDIRFYAAKSFWRKRELGEPLFTLIKKK